ncbi:MAG: YadA-like family protein, partial [Neisseria sp.]|nr:YadA-like family protein [Neisseria sp.]
IGLQGPRGDNGKDGLGATLKIGAGPAGVDGKDGFDGIPGKDGENGKPRIVYTPIDPATGQPAVDNEGNPIEEKVATLNDGLKFVGNDGKEVVKKLNETLAIKGGLDNDKPASAKNVRVDNENGELIVKIAEKPEFQGVSLKTGDDANPNVVNLNTDKPDTLTLSGNGGTAPVTVANVKGNLPNTYNVDALNKVDPATGKPNDVTKSQQLPDNAGDIVNNAATVGDVLNAGFNLQANGQAADFVKPYDTVNFADGKNTKVRIDTAPDGKVNTVRVDVDLEPLNKRIGDVEKEGRAGIAGATAMTNLPQVTLPGASMVAAGVGHYKGQSALAIGVSRLSDGGNWIVKAQASANTKGDFNVGAGIGYQWR